MQVNSDKLMQILGMGITQNVDDISTALLCTNNNVDDAVVFLLANMTSSSGNVGANAPPKPVAKPKRFFKTPYGDGEIIEETFTEMTLAFDWGKLILPKGNENRPGAIRRTKQRFKKEVIADSPNDVYLFGDNDIDFNRTNPEREYSGGMASAWGPFDRSRCYGLMTTFYGSKNPSLEEFKDIMSTQFESIRKFLAHGLDIVVPEPNIADLSGFYAKNYHKDGVQVITHNLGTGLSGLSQEHLLVIEQFLNDMSQENIALVEKQKKVEPSGKGEVPADLRKFVASEKQDMEEEVLGVDEDYDMIQEEEVMGI